MTRQTGIIVVSCIALVAIATAVSLTVFRSEKEYEGEKAAAKAEAEEEQVKSSNKVVKQICQPTDYRHTCEKSLKGSNTSNPKELVKRGFEVAAQELEKAVNESDTIQDLAKDDMGKQALKNCKELMDSSIDDLRRSMSEVDEYDPNKMEEYLEDLKVWLSGALTFQQTCLDGFDKTTGEAKEKMKEFLETSLELTQNGIAMVEEVGNMFESLSVKGLSNRRLLAEGGTPAWVRRLLGASIKELKPNVVVAKDGSGKYNSINEALGDVPEDNQESFVIHVKEGVYAEQVVFSKHMTSVVLLGDGPTKTRITGSLNAADGIQTFSTATVSVIGNSFIAKDVGFENTAGPSKEQAVALRVQADKSVFYNCHILGYQETLYSHAHRQFYRDCTISGTIDFIFGNAAALFQNCLIHVRKPLPDQNCIVAAQGRLNKNEPTGFVLQNCTISAQADLTAEKAHHSVYLGRPRRMHSRTVVIQSQIDDIIDPAGWSVWQGTMYLNSLWFGEYGNRGGGADSSKRVMWRGYKTLTAQHAQDFTAQKFLYGNKWVPQTGVPYVGGWMNL